MMKLKIIKTISQPNFELMLGEDPVTGMYYILYTIQERDKVSDPIKDFGLASFVFDQKLQELEGH